MQSEHLADPFRPLIELSNARARRDDFGLAEPSSDRGRWYVLVTQPNHEATTASHLVGRRFGTYIPSYRPDGPQSALRPLFPGYVFVWVWGMKTHQRRILAVPGAVEFLAETVECRDDKGRIIDKARPAAVPDAVMKAISVLEDELMLAAMPRSFRRKRKGVEIVSISMYSALDRAEVLDGTHGNGALSRALGLGSSG